MTGAILAGGQSRRMGTDKAFLEVGGRRIIDRTVELLGPLFPQLLLVTNNPVGYAYLGIRMVSDLLPGRGALGGLYTALFFSTTQHVFVVACDMPFLRVEVIRHLLRQSQRWDVVVPQMGDHVEPLHAVYSRRCLPHVEALLQKGGRKVMDFYSSVRVLRVPEQEIRALDPELLSFRNVNTPEEIRVIQEMTSQLHARTDPHRPGLP
ncbi:MAG: molybdenum cofactor guanylyltransferase [Thermodesulfobacteriota bacterium]